MTHLSAVVGLALLGLSQSKTALLLIDVQECFLETGSLPVTASHIIPKLNNIIGNKSCLFDHVFKSQDFHPAGHISFASTHGKGLAGHTPLGSGAWQGLVDLMCLKPTSGKTGDAACCPTYYVNASAVDCSATMCPGNATTVKTDFYTTAPGNGIITGNAACTTCKTDPGSCFRDTQSLWKDHCLQTGDSGFANQLTSKTTDIVVQKGTNKFVDAYSAFMDNSRFLKTALDSELQAKGVTTLYVAGIATDVCVKWTVRDARSSDTGNYTVKVIADASAGIFAGTGTANQAEADTYFTQQGATVVQTADVLAMACPSGSSSGTTGTGNLASGSMPSSSSSTLLMAAMIFWYLVCNKY